MATPTCVRNFIDLHTHLSGAVKVFHVIIRNLAPHPHAGAIQTLVIGHDILHRKCHTNI